MHLVQIVLQLLAGAVLVGQVDQQQVVVRAAGDQLHTAGGQLGFKRLRVLNDFAGILLELRLQRLAKADGLRGDDVLQRAALRAGEDGGVDALDDILVVRQNQAAAGAAQRLVGRGGDHVGVGYGALVLAACDKTRNVRHIDHQHRAVAVGDLGQLLKVDGAGIGRCTGDQQLGADLRDLLGQCGVVDAAILGGDTVGDKVVVLAAHVHGGAVGQVAALGQIHAHDGVADVQQRKVDGQVGLCAGVRLDVGILRAEQLAGAVNGDLLDLIDVLAAAVITVAGVPFRVLVRQHAAHGRHDGGGNDVLAGDQLNVLPLAAQLTLHSRAQLGVVALHKADGVDDVLVHTAFPPNVYAVHGGKRPRADTLCARRSRRRASPLQRPLGGQNAVDPRISARRGVQRLGKRLEHGLQLMVVILPVEHLQMQIHHGAVRYGVEKLPRHLGVHAAAALACKAGVVHKVGPPAQIDGAECQRLIHRQHAAAVPHQPGLVAQRFFYGRAQRNADVLNCVVAVYVQVAAAGDAYIKQAVAGEAVQHVVKKADARVQVGPAGAVQVNRQRDLCLPRIAGDRRDACHRNPPL